MIVDPPAHRIQLKDIRCAADPACRSAGTAQYRPHTRHQFPQAEGFDDIVIRPHLQPDDPIYLRITGGQIDNRSFSQLTDSPEELETTAVRETDIQQNERWWGCFERRKTSGAGRKMLSHEPLSLQRKLHGLCNRGFVLDNKYAVTLHCAIMLNVPANSNWIAAPGRSGILIRKRCEFRRRQEKRRRQSGEN